MKNKSIYLIPASVLLLLAGFFLFKNNQTTNETNTAGEGQNLDISSQAVATKIIIDAKKCIGCGHCARTSPANFKMDNNTRKALVISSENYDSAAVRQTINNCPVAAISLN
ncbi:MAG: ferredoxin [Patescibacteria group bacterium]